MQTTLTLFSTSPVAGNTDARPARRAESGLHSSDIVAWATSATLDTATLSPLAAWLAANVQSTLRSGTTLRLTSRELNSDLMRREGRSEDEIRSIVACYGDEHVTIDWRFSQFDPRVCAADQWIEREARNILALNPARIRTANVVGTLAEFDMTVIGTAQ